MSVAPRLDCLAAGLAVVDHVCQPVARLPQAGGLELTSGLQLTIGGCAANAAVDLARLGVRTGIAARLGDDFLGEFAARTLAQAGVDTTWLLRTPGVETSGTLVINVLGEDRRFIHALGANARFDGSEVAASLLDQTRVLYVGGYFAMPSLAPAVLAALFQAARARQVRTVLDVVLTGPGDYRTPLQTILPSVDVFLPNEDEARILTGLVDPLAQARQCRAWGARTVVITCGGAGCVAVGPEGEFRAGAFAVPFVDGTGSGDAFDAGFIFGLLEGAPLDACVRYGSALGASCVQQPGATTGVFDRRELAAFLAARGHEFTWQPVA